MTQAFTQMIRDGLTLCVDGQSSLGAPVLFQHGLCGDSSQTREAFPNPLNYCQVTLECRGHGRSEAGDLPKLSIATFADDAIALIETMADEPIVVGGISMGAAIALRIAVIRPDLVRALILVRPAWITASAPPNMEPNAQVGTLLHQHPPEAARAIFLESEIASYLAQVAPDNFKSLEGFFKREPLEVTSALLRQIACDGPGVSDDQVRALRIPALVVGHDRDYIHPYSHAQALAELIPRSTLKAITPKAISKELYLSDLHKAITEFLEDLPQ